MRTLLIIGVGAGHPDQITLQAIKALARVDVFFSIDKGEEKAALNHIRDEICAAHRQGRSYRAVAIPDPPRNRASAAYREAVKDWHARRADIFEETIARELRDGECGGYLVWGDPALYDSTLRIIEEVAARGALALAYEVIPGISSVQALAAAHRICLNEIGGSLLITTGRQAAKGLPENFGSVVVMLDADCAFKALKQPGVHIYWGAYLGTPEEILLAGDLLDVAEDIERVRAAARARNGWIFDIYLLRRAGGA